MTSQPPWTLRNYRLTGEAPLPAPVVVQPQVPIPVPAPEPLKVARIDPPAPPKVIMITANEGGRHKAYAEMLGVVDYLRKPLAMDVLLDTVRRALDGVEPEKKPAATRRRVLKKKDDESDD